MRVTQSKELLSETGGVLVDTFIVHKLVRIGIVIVRILLALELFLVSVSQIVDFSSKRLDDVFVPAPVVIG